jgi:hypothetical protein
LPENLDEEALERLLYPPPTATAADLQAVWACSTARIRSRQTSRRAYAVVEQKVQAVISVMPIGRWSGSSGRL